MFKYLVNCVTSSVYVLVLIKLVFGSPHSPARQIVDIETQDPTSEVTSSVHKTYKHDINVKKPSVIVQPIVAHHHHPHHPLSGTFLSEPAIAPVLGHQETLVSTPIGAHTGIILPHEEENHHLFREESENLSKRPVVGVGGVISPVGVFEKDNTEKTYRRDYVKKPFLSGGIASPILTY